MDGAARRCGAAAFIALPSELAPDEDRGSVSIVVEAPEGASFEQTPGKVEEIERALAGYVGQGEGRPVEQVLSILVPGRGGTQAPSNTGRVILRLKPWGERNIKQAELQRGLQGRLSAIPGVRAFAVSPPKLGQRGRGRQMQFVISGTSRRLVPLSAVASTREVGAPRELQRLDRLAAVTVEAKLTPTLPLGDALDRLDAIARAELPATAQIGHLGESLDFRETGNTVFVILALVLVLAGQFESWLHPLVVLTIAPLGVAGGLVTLWALGLTVNVYSQIGMVLLVGLAAKNGILIVEFANQLRDEGKGARDAVLEAAAARLRPILMTSVATVLGAMPLAVASGAGAEARAIIGLVTAGGLTLGTLLTLFVVPALYLLVSGAAAAPGEIEEELRRLEESHPEPESAPAPS